MTRLLDSPAIIVAAGLVLLSQGGVAAGPELKTAAFTDFRTSYTTEDEDGSAELGEAEIDAILSGEAGEDGRLVRADLEGKDGDVRFEQAYLQIPIAGTTSGTLKLGRMDFPIGFENLDPVDPLGLRRMFHISHSQIFQRGLRTHFDGIMYSLDGDPLELSLFLGAELDELNFFGWHLSLVPEDLPKNLDRFTGKFWKLGIGSTHQIEDEVGDSNPEWMFNIDLTISAFKKLTLGGEWNRGSDESILEQSQSWGGLMLSAKYDINEKWEIAARFDSFDDEDAVRGLGDELLGYAISPTWAFSPGIDCRAEWRYEKFEGIDGFVDGDGEPSDDRHLLMLQLIYSFERRPVDDLL